MLTDGFWVGMLGGTSQMSCAQFAVCGLYRELVFIWYQFYALRKSSCLQAVVIRPKPAGLSPNKHLFYVLDRVWISFLCLQ